MFVNRPGRVLSRETILNAALNRNLEPFDRSVDVLVGRLRRKIEPDLKMPRLIVTVPGEGYRFDGLSLRFQHEETLTVSAYPNNWRPEEGSKSPLPPSLALPDRPSIAVMPFQNMSGDAEQDYFADGMVEDIVTGLSRIKWLFVIARNSSFIYKGRVVDVRQVGRELGVRYLLEGSVRKAGARLRITAQLLEAETGAHLWADKFDGELEDVFELQDQITDRVVGILEPSLRKSEIERSRRERTESLDAYDLYLRSLPYLTPMSPANAEIAAGFLRDALRINPDYAAAHAFLAFAHEI